MSSTSSAKPLLQDALTTGQVATWLKEVQLPAERTRQLGKLSESELRLLGEILDAKSAEDLLDSVDKQLAARTVSALDPAVAAPLIDALHTDRATEVLRAMKDPAREAVLLALPAERAAALRALQQWPKDSVAAHMVSEFLLVDPDLTVGQAITEVRQDAAALRHDSRTGAYIYVTAADRRLLGVVVFRDLVLAEPGERVSALMNDALRSVSPLTDAEEAAQALEDANLVAMPVIDEDGHLLGLLTEHTAADILEEEATEDAERQGGSAPLELPYLRASPLRLWRKRIGWLLLLFAAEAYTGTVLRAFEEEMEAVVALAFFIPLLIGTGGNTGTQITTTLVRAMAIGELRLRDLPTVLAKELSTGVLVALTMALAAVIRAWMLGVGPEVTLTVSLTIGAVVMWASLVASILPPVLKKLGIDPALVSSPMIATVVDGTGLMIYFWIAHLTLSQLQGL